METNDFTFPAYRKYVGLSVWFKIVDAATFIEIKQVGNRFVVEKVEAVQYPEKLRIQDMLVCHEGRWEKITEATFVSVSDRANS